VPRWWLGPPTPSSCRRLAGPVQDDAGSLLGPGRARSKHAAGLPCWSKKLGWAQTGGSRPSASCWAGHGCAGRSPCMDWSCRCSDTTSAPTHPQHVHNAYARQGSHLAPGRRLAPPPPPAQQGSNIPRSLEKVGPRSWQVGGLVAHQIGGSGLVVVAQSLDDILGASCRAETGSTPRREGVQRGREWVREGGRGTAGSGRVCTPESPRPPPPPPPPPPPAPPPSC